MILYMYIHVYICVYLCVFVQVCIFHRTGRYVTRFRYTPANIMAKINYFCIVLHCIVSATNLRNVLQSHISYILLFIHFREVRNYFENSYDLNESLYTGLKGNGLHFLQQQLLICTISMLISFFSAI